MRIEGKEYRMKRIKICGLWLLFIFSELPAAANGFGLYLNTGYEETDLTYDYDVEHRDFQGNPSDYEWLDIDESYDIIRTGFGFTFDTLAAPPVWFNYRLSLAGNYVTMATTSDEIDGGLDYSGFGLLLKNTLRFTLMNSDKMQWWLGPSLKLSWERLTADDRFEHARVDDYTYSWLLNRSLGIGPEVGIDLQLSPKLTCALALAAHYTRSSAKNYIKNTRIEDFYGTTYIRADGEAAGDGILLFLEATLFFMR